MEVSRATVERELETRTAALTPVDEKALVVLLDRTLALWKLPDNWSEIAAFYLEALRDLPIDLLEKALRHVRMTCKFLPKPAELREAVAKDLDERRADALRCRMLLRWATFKGEERRR